MSQSPQKPKPAAAKPAPAARPANRPAAPQPTGKPAPGKPMPVAAAAQPQAGEAPPEEFEGGGSNFMLHNAMPSVLTSMIFHVILFLALTLVVITVDDPSLVTEFVMGPDNKEDVEEIEEFEEVEVEELNVETEQFEATDFSPVESTVETVEPNISPADDIEAAQVSVPEFDPLGDTSVPKSDMLATIGSYTGSALSGRGSAAGRKRIAKAAGGNDASEAAVAMALKWIASRQARDGGWNFDHNDPLINAPRCPDPGSASKARNGATAMALLPFFGAGQTHKEGNYKPQVYAGLAYLIKNMKVQGKTGSWHEAEGSMYSHGLALDCHVRGLRDDA